MRIKVNYLSNKELMQQIHQSKKTYCSYISDSDADYDLFIDSSESIKEIKSKLSCFDKPIESVIFRIMTYEHVPSDLTKVKKNGKTVKVSKLNFPPFKHFKLINDELVEVCRSHWIGGFDNGYFSMDHGKITSRLAKSMMELVERYSKRNNWRNYSYLEEMKGSAICTLFESGLKYDESKGNNPFAYFTMCCLNSFRSTLHIEKKQSEIRNKIMVDNGYDPSFNSQDD